MAGPGGHDRLPRLPFQFPDIGQLVQKRVASLTDAMAGVAKPLSRLQEEIGRLGASAAASAPWSQWNPTLKKPGRHKPAFRPCFASLSSGSRESTGEGGLFDIAMGQEQVAKTLEGVPVYTVSNSGNEFVLVSDPEGSKSLSLLCFRQQDAEALLTQVRDREPVLGREARVVSVPLDKVYKLSAEGIAFRFLPDPIQVRNAIETKVKSGDKVKAFDGVPVFQSENLILKSTDRRYIPIFFRKEDLEKALAKASKEIYRSNPAFRAGISIQVGSLEDVLKRLEVNDESSGWNDFVFVPPGKDAVQHLGKALG